jgi:septum formation protein
MIKLSKKLILASNSPRRKELMTNAGFEFEVRTKDTNEDFSAEMPLEEVPVFLAKKKALAFKNEIQDEVFLCADTVVIIENQILNKPADYDEAFKMLKLLSGKNHHVVTGICLMTKDEIITTSDKAEVYFKDLTDWEIDYYIKTCKPFDKAGAYGVQDFIGLVGIPKIIGSHFTIMGLPVHVVYQKMLEMGLVIG